LFAYSYSNIYNIILSLHKRTPTRNSNRMFKKQTGVLELPIEFLFQKVQKTPCSNCQKPTTNRCGGCKVLYFCSRKCQKTCWKEHKNECKQIQSQKEYVNKVRELKKKTDDPFVNHMRATPRQLNTTKYSKREYFGWRDDPDLVEQKEKRRTELIAWTTKTFPDFKVETITNVKTCKQYEKLVKKCHSRRKWIVFLTFDFKHEWCILQANNLAVTGDPVFRDRAVCMDGGWYMLVYDSYGLGGLIDIEFEKKTIENIVASLGTTYQCFICQEYHTAFNHLCHQCNNDVCKTCAEEIIKRNNNNYNCPFCRQETNTSSAIKRCEVCKKWYDTDAHVSCPSCS
jgi:hypothetical protein